MMVQVKKEKGFTLIELMIVVAIIGILAAIAIPQFSSYRIKAFNAAAISDIQTARLAEEALFADFQAYGGTSVSGTPVAAAAGTLVTSASTKPVVATGVASQESPLSISKNVALIAEVDAASVTAAVIAQHKNGDKTYTVQTDFSGIYYNTATPGTALVLAGKVTPVAGTAPTGTSM